jgi:hypothetical protein
MGVVTAITAPPLPASEPADPQPATVSTSAAIAAASIAAAVPRGVRLISDAATV